MRLLGRRSGLLFAGGGLSAAARATRYGLVAAYGLSDLLDGFGASTLTNNNVATFGAGQVGNAAYLAATSSQFLSCADNAALSTGDVDFWVTGWAYWASLGTSRGVVCKFTDATHREWALFYDQNVDGAEAAQRVRFKTYTTAGAQAGIVSTPAGPGTAAWRFLMAYRDKANARVGLSIDGGAFSTNAETGVPADTTANLIIGALSNGTGSFMDGRIDAVHYGKAPVGGMAGVANEIRDYLWAGGAGREWPW